MIEIDRTIVSMDIFEKRFVCDISKCKGVCCVDGESGAPLDKDEPEILEDIYNTIKPFMTETGIKAVEEQGTWLIDSDDDEVTPLVNGAECAYAFFEDGLTLCAIEKAWEKGIISFRKPISCHLYPIRIQEYKNFDAVNYEVWEKCENCSDISDGTKLFEYLKEPLINKYGEQWYQKLVLASKEVCQMHETNKKA